MLLFAPFLEVNLESKKMATFVFGSCFLLYFGLDVFCREYYVLHGGPLYFTCSESERT